MSWIVLMPTRNVPGEVSMSVSRVVAAGLHRGGDDEGLDARAGLEDVGGRAVAVARGGVLLAVVRVERRLVGHRQHFAGRDVEHDAAPDCARLACTAAFSSR